MLPLVLFAVTFSLPVNNDDRFDSYHKLLGAYKTSEAHESAESLRLANMAFLNEIMSSKGLSDEATSALTEGHLEDTTNPINYSIDHPYLDANGSHDDRVTADHFTTHIAHSDADPDIHISDDDLNELLDF